jgi:hypothetical protein
MNIVLAILAVLGVMGALTFYSGYIACRQSLRKRVEENSALKKELDFTKFQNETLRKEIRDEKNKNLILESLLKQK